MPKKPAQKMPTCRNSTDCPPPKSREAFSTNTARVASAAENITMRPSPIRPAPASITIISTGMPLR